MTHLKIPKKFCIVKRLLAVYVFILLLSLCHQAFALEDDESNFPAASVTFESGYVLSAEVEDRSTDVQITRLDLGIDSSFITFGYALRSYQWDQPGNLTQITNNEDPFQHLHALSLGLQYYDEFTEESRWQYYIGGGIVSAFEKELDDSLQFNLIGGCGYKLSDQWEVGVGVGLSINAIEPVVFPVARVSYISASVKREGRGLAASIGFPETAVSYAVSRMATIKGYVTIDGNTYRLANDNPLAAEGYARTFDAILGAKCIFGLAESLKASIGFEYNLSREYSIYDSGGSKLFIHDVDNAAGFMGSLTYTF